jgi:hypothetical protein
VAVRGPARFRVHPRRTGKTLGVLRGFVKSNQVTRCYSRSDALLPSVDDRMQSTGASGARRKPVPNPRWRRGIMLVTIRTSGVRARLPGSRHDPGKRSLSGELAPAGAARRVIRTGRPADSADSGSVTDRPKPRGARPLAAAEAPCSLTAKPRRAHDPASAQPRRLTGDDLDTADGALADPEDQETPVQQVGGARGRVVRRHLRVVQVGAALGDRPARG